MSVSPHARWFLWIGTVLLGASLVMGCATSGATSDSSSSDQGNTSQQEQPQQTTEETQNQRTDRPDPVKVLRTQAVRRQLQYAAEDWYGVPYKWGGTTKEGVDCSALVRNVYQDAFGRRLPRVTDEQVQTGTRIPKSELRPGDLVFFRPQNEYNHVGVYLGGEEFVHASSSKGVRDSPIDKNYWQKYYWTARRTLQVSNVPDSLESDLIAYQYPDTTAQTPLTADEVSRDASSQAPSDTTRIASCSAAGVNCADASSSEEEEASASAESEARQRKGW